MEGIDQGAFHRALQDAVGDLHRQHVRVAAFGRLFEGHVRDYDAFLPAADGLDHVVAHQLTMDNWLISFELSYRLVRG